MFANGKRTKIFTVLVIIEILWIVFGITFSLVALITGKEPGGITQNGPEYLMIRAVFFGVVALGAFVFEKEAQSKYAGIIGTILATIGFAVSIFN